MIANNLMSGNANTSPFLPEAAEWLSGIALPSELAVAWSGGADSTALLLALASQGHRVQAWHIDHGWRESSANEAEILRIRAANWGIPFLSVRDSTTSIQNREAAARSFRFRQFAAWGELVGMKLLCLAHHRQDQAETICLRMLQGAGVHGICGMADMRSINGLQMVRPLLHVSSEALRQALQNVGVTWIEDASNQDLSLWRNRIRHRVFPALTKAGVDPCQLFHRWGEQAECLAAIIDAEVVKVPIENTGRGVFVDWHDWKNIMPSVRARLLQKMTQKLFGEGVVPGRRHIRMIESWTTRGGSGGLDLSRSRLYRREGRLYLVPAEMKFDLGRHG